MRLIIGSGESSMSQKVRVFCPTCKGGNNAIWEGSLLDWDDEGRQQLIPDWYLYARNHEKVHGHEIMVEDPTGSIVPLRAIILRE